jgi:nucleoside-diphosphate-sugar epimerase
LHAEGWETDILVRQQGQRARGGRNARSYDYDGSTESVLAAVADSQPDVVFHLASLFLADHSPAHIDPLVASNILFGTQVLEAMNVHSIRRFVNVGSYWQHYQGREYDPVCLYAATKQAFQALMTYYVCARDLSAITLELFDTYGPNDTRPKLLQALQAAAEHGQPIQMSPGAQQLSFVYIDDVLDAFMLAADRLLRGAVIGSENFVVNADHPISLRDLVGEFSRALGKSIDARWAATPYRARQIMVPYTEGSRMPGWRPKVKLQEGLRRLCSGHSLSNLGLGSKTGAALPTSGISDAVARR